MFKNSFDFFHIFQQRFFLSDAKVGIGCFCLNIFLKSLTKYMIC